LREGGQTRCLAFVSLLRVLDGIVTGVPHDRGLWIMNGHEGVPHDPRPHAGSLRWTVFRSCILAFMSFLNQPYKAAALRYETLRHDKQTDDLLSRLLALHPPTAPPLPGILTKYQDTGPRERWWGFGQVAGACSLICLVSKGEWCLATTTVFCHRGCCPGGLDPGASAEGEGSAPHAAWVTSPPSESANRV
jgi:hypothetical protein